MSITRFLTSIDADGAVAGGLAKRRLIAIYLTGGTLALLTNVILGVAGLDFSKIQLRVALSCLAIACVFCIAIDIVLILRCFAPVDAFLKSAQPHDDETARRAFSRAIDLPALSVLRVEFIHIPVAVILIFVPIFIYTATGRLHFSATQFALMLVLGLMNGTIHSMVEYYLVSKLTGNLLERMYAMSPGAARAGAHGALFLNARIKFYFIYLLIAVMPLIFLGVTLVIKAGKLTDGNEAVPALLPWAAIFIAVSSVTSFLMSFVLSSEIIDPVKKISEAMKRVENGNFNETILITTADEFSVLHRGFNSMTEGLMEREAIKQKFGRYVSQSVLRGILEKDPALGGEEKTVTILFADLRDFTGYAENRPAAEIVRVLNAYFSEMVIAIEKHNGILDKFIGDALMAVFGAPADDERHADNALSAAVEMLDRLEAFNRRDDGQGRKLDIGVGISTGKALVGNIGSESRMEYTAIGDTVNLASRLESLTKETGRRILFSETTRDQLTMPIEVLNVGTFQIRGRKTPCSVFTIQ